jgi:hypothetical protein
MAEGWYTPEPVAVQVQPRAGAFELRPLSLGEVLDRTFTVYRSRFWLFAGMTALYATVALAFGLLNLAVKHLLLLHAGAQTANVGTVVIASVAGLVMVAPAAITQAATVFALSEVYLGRSITAMDAYRTTWGRWYRYAGIGIWVGVSAVWLPSLLLAPAFVIVLMKNVELIWLAGILFFLAFCAMPYGVWAFIRNSLAIQASVLEGSAIRASMKRSKVLSKGARWRILVVLLIVIALFSTAGALQIPLALVILRSPLEEHNLAQVITLFVNAIAQTLVTPVGLIGLSLVYFDQRVRQEAFDLLMMLGPAPVAAPTTAFYAEAETVATSYAGSVAAVEETPLSPSPESNGDDGTV